MWAKEYLHTVFCVVGTKPGFKFMMADLFLIAALIVRVYQDFSILLISFLTSFLRYTHL